MARLIGEVCQRCDDVALVALSLANVTANSDRDLAPYIDFRKVSVTDGLEQGIVSRSYRESIQIHSLVSIQTFKKKYRLPYWADYT